MTSICIIPARGGSKRIKRKNIREFCGRPIILHSIDVARESGLFGEIIVSTDSDEVIGAVQGSGVTTLRRPAELADDHATTAQVLTHALRYREGVERFCCIYPCAPFLEVADLTQGCELLKNSRALSVFAATEFDAPVERAIRWDAKLGMTMAFPKHRNTRSQDLLTWYRDIGMFYWVNAERFRCERVLWHWSSRAVIIPRERAIDIDTEEDWRRAEQMYRRLHSDDCLAS